LLLLGIVIATAHNPTAAAPAAPAPATSAQATPVLCATFLDAELGVEDAVLEADFPDAVPVAVVGGEVMGALPTRVRLPYAKSVPE
jgi:hypothetical protein